MEAEPGIILIVEDEESLRFAQAKFLRKRGFTVREAATGPAGVDAALEEPVPAVIVMDIMLPGVDGVAATRAIHSNPRTADVQVIASTGAVLGQIGLESARFLRVLHKPYPLGELCAAVEEAMSLAR